VAAGAEAVTFDEHVNQALALVAPDPSLTAVEREAWAGLEQVLMFPPRRPWAHRRPPISPVPPTSEVEQ
jgi:hypothetical protein